MKSETSSSHQDKRILYVDDEPQALKYFSQLFGDRFHTVTAVSADEGFQIIQSDPAKISVLVTDQRMPGRTGVDLMEQVKDEYPNIVRVLTTAHSHLESAIKAVNEGGAFRYLTKPWDEDEMIGTLLRAQEYHEAMTDRQRLMSEKLSVLHRLVVMDRVRGLATMATAFKATIRNSWPALVNYMEQSKLSHRIKIQMEEIAGLNMIAVARREAQSMIQTVDMIIREALQDAGGDTENIAIAQWVSDFASSASPPLSEDDLELLVQTHGLDINIHTEPDLLHRMLQIMIRRMADVQEHPAKITIELGSSKTASTDEMFHITVRGGFDALTDDQLASFFAAAVPLKKWPIDLDMDLLSCFMISHHLGGSFEVHPQSPGGPSFVATLPLAVPVEPASIDTDQASFETVFASLSQWQEEAFLHDDESEEEAIA